MNEPVSEATWRNRFIIMNLVQIGGTVIVLIGLLLWQSDVFVEGGSVVGFGMALVGLVISFFAPRRLARYWKRRSGP